MKLIYFSLQNKLIFQVIGTPPNYLRLMNATLFIPFRYLL